MRILVYNDLHVTRVKAQFDRAMEELRNGQFHAAEVKKLGGTPYYRAKLNDTDRLLFRFGACRGETCLFILEVISQHAYEKSRFLNGATVDESKLIPFETPEKLPEADRLPIPYVNPHLHHFHLLDKILSLDDAQNEALHLRPPLILIGSAGSGKTALVLEKIKPLKGDILYVTLSAFLTENSRNLYYANGFSNEDQNLDFLSFRELIETMDVPEGAAMSFQRFNQWFAGHRPYSPIKNGHQLYEEFQGVLTGSSLDKPFLSREEYLGMGIRRSIFTGEDRPHVYSLFGKYLEFLKESGAYDLNLLAFDYLARCQPAYDFVVADEVQDLTPIQLSLILRKLRRPENFILCGDSNQIVHPNFFSWTGVKAMFYREQPEGQGGIIRILYSNYRNSPQVTGLANRLLLIKQSRFGSIDRESNYLVKSVAAREGTVELLQDTDKVKRELNEKTQRSTHYAVLVLRPEDRDEARRFFRTPLLFSIQDAKGLEYDNIILFNFVSGHRREFADITDSVSALDLEAEELRYARARDKRDKSLDAYKFFINALYVGITRAIRNVLWIEADTSHRLFPLLKLGISGTQAARVKGETSSRDEWQEEARKLDLQGKKEQADEIRRTILNAQPVPWKVITTENFGNLKKEALDRKHYNRQAKLLLFEYAVMYSVPSIFDLLVRHGFNAALDPERERPNVERKYLQEYQDRGLQGVDKKIQQHGPDFRNPLNQTPLMLAARVGCTNLVRRLVRHGADPILRDNWGRIPLQVALREAFRSEQYARENLGAIYAELAQSSLKVRVEGRLVKVDRHTMEYFLLHSMIALLQEVLRHKIEHSIPGFETGDFVHQLRFFPDPVIPEYRRRRPYLSSVLAKNEVFRRGPGNRMLFVRIFRGFYLPNPLMDIEDGEKWINVYDLIGIGFLAQEKGNRKIQHLLKVLADIKRTMAEFRRATQEHATVAERSPAPPPSEVVSSSASAPNPTEVPPHDDGIEGLRIEASRQAHGAME